MRMTIVNHLLRPASGALPCRSWRQGLTASILVNRVCGLSDQLSRGTFKVGMVKQCCLCLWYLGWKKSLHSSALTHSVSMDVAMGWAMLWAMIRKKMFPPPARTVTGLYLSPRRELAGKETKEYFILQSASTSRPLNSILRVIWRKNKRVLCWLN